MRIALFGGTFDPIHDAHLSIAKEAARRFALDRVLFVPASQPPHKTGVTRTSYEDRYRMVEIACRDQPLFEPSRLEEDEGKSYSIRTIERLRDRGDQLFFLIGADAFAEIRTWHRWRDVVRAVEFIVVSRPGTICEFPPGARVHRLEGLNFVVSSSEIRERLTAGDDRVSVPPGVLAYIRERRLYSRHN